MKEKILLIALILCSGTFYGQNKVISKTENSRIFKGTIQSSPVTIFLENKEIIDCDRYDTFVEGWYYYDKYKIKIPLSGFVKDWNMKLFNFGTNHLNYSKTLSKQAKNSTIDSLYLKSNYQEALLFNRGLYSEVKGENLKGVFKTLKKSSEIVINSDNINILQESEIYKLPNSKEINLLKLFSGYGGNSFYSSTIRKDQNRVVFYFESISNHNACGRCGASEGEKGYRVVYFDKKWNVTEKDEFLIESCISSIYDSKIVKKSTSEIKYKIINDGTYGSKVPYYLVINKVNSTIRKVF